MRQPLTLICCLLLPLFTVAQKTAVISNRGNDGVKKIKTFVPDVFLGRSNLRNGYLKKNLFDSLLRSGLTSADSMGDAFKVIGFDFTYGERKLYEDSMANLEVITDYLYEYCPGDTVSAGVSQSLYSRTKPGDTLFFDKIKIARILNKNGSAVIDTNVILGKPMKFVITK